MKVKPDLSFWKLWNLSFGFFGVQIAYALQSANVSRIFATLGADPHDLSYFWILPPLMGLLVQPIVGTMSDRTWNRFGRRLPYLIVGAGMAVIVMCVLPNSGSFHLAVSQAIIMGIIALMLLDTSINMAMQPFKMLVGDMVNEKQKGLAYSIQSFLCNAGSVVGFVFPFLLTWIGIENTAAAGVVPPTVVYSFYAGAAILLLCVIYSLIKIKEWPPKLYDEYNGVDSTADTSNVKRDNLFKLLIKAPSTFWTVGVVQFFCWMAFLFMWTYTNGTVAQKAFDCPVTENIDALRFAEKDGLEVQHKAKFVLAASDKKLLIANGKEQEGCDIKALPANSQLLFANVMGKDPNSGELFLDEVTKVTVPSPSDIVLERRAELDTNSSEYNAAGNWVGILFAVQALGSVAWALILPRFRSRKFSYALSLVLGAGGFISAGFFTNQWLLFISFALIGCAWAAMLAWPFTILTNSLKGGNIGAYLGLFNCTITIPQIVGALLGGVILGCFGSANEVAPQYVMMVIAGIALAIGAFFVIFIKENREEKNVPVIADIANNE